METMCFRLGNAEICKISWAHWSAEKLFRTALEEHLIPVRVVDRGYVPDGAKCYKDLKLFEVAGVEYVLTAYYSVDIDYLAYGAAISNPDGCVYPKYRHPLSEPVVIPALREYYATVFRRVVFSQYEDSAYVYKHEVAPGIEETRVVLDNCRKLWTFSSSDPEPPTVAIAGLDILKEILYRHATRHAKLNAMVARLSREILETPVTVKVELAGKAKPKPKLLIDVDTPEDELELT